MFDELLRKSAASAQNKRKLIDKMRDINIYKGLKEGLKQTSDPVQLEPWQVWVNEMHGDVRRIEGSLTEERNFINYLR